MLALASSSLVTQLPLSSLSLASQSALAAFIPRNRARFCSQLLRCIHSADCSGFASGCCRRRCSERRGTFSCSCSSSLLHVPPSPHSGSSAALRAAGHSELRRLGGLCFTSGDTGRLSLQGRVDLRRPELWRFHQWAARGISGINGGNIWVKSSISFGETEKMTSVASRAGGRQLRERKETSFSMSTEAIGRKKTKGLAQETDAPDDEMELRQGTEESALPREFEARLWDLDKSNKLATLTVLELRGYMKLMSKPTAGRKDELISTVKEWLANRGSSTLAKNRQAQAVQETSSDAESLEGALLKAENKNREVEAEAMSRGTDMSTKRENRKRKDGAVPDKKAVQQEARTSAAQKRTAGDTPTSTKRKLSKNSQELDGSDDEKPAAKAVTKKKNQSSSVMESNGAGPVVLKENQGRKRKLEQVAKIVQKETSLQTVEENGVEITIDPKKPWLTLVHKKPSPDWVVYDPDTMRPPPLPSSVKHVKLLSWNVNGWRALMKDKKAQECLNFKQLAKDEDFDVICLQETKLQEKDVEQISTSLPPEYSHNFWNCSTGKLGYAGTAMISRVKPLSVKYGMGIPDHDKEGRLITAEFDNFYLVTGYVPNSGDKLVRLEYRTTNWDPSLSQYLKELEKNKPVIYTGDLNCANEEIDINNPAGNRRSAGFTDEERESFKTNFLNNGFVDTFRQQHPNVLGYTYWGYRTGARPKNNGWRLDYFLVSECLMNQVHDSYIRPDVLGSDHCPIGVIVKV